MDGSRPLHRRKQLRRHQVRARNRAEAERKIEPLEFRAEPEQTPRVYGERIVPDRKERHVPAVVPRDDFTCDLARLAITERAAGDVVRAERTACGTAAAGENASGHDRSAVSAV